MPRVASGPRHRGNIVRAATQACQSTNVTMSLRIEDDSLEMPGTLLAEPGIIHLREPRGANVSGLLKRLRSGNYPKPFVVDDGTVRRLHFSLDYVQSEMSVKDPYALTFPYTRKMMAFLLFTPQPRHVVIVGLGGGSLTKFCHRQLPRARITTVEIDDDVIAFGKLFDVPAQDGRMRVVHANAVEYFATTNDCADVVLIDGCDRYGVAPEFCNDHFYQTLRQRMSPDGMLVMNLIGPVHICRAHLRFISETFPGRLMVQDVSYGGNRLVFSFNDPAFRPDWPSIQRLAGQLARRHGLDFPAFAKKLHCSEQIQASGARNP